MEKLWVTLSLIKLTRNDIHGVFLVYIYVKIDITPDPEISVEMAQRREP